MEGDWEVVGLPEQVLLVHLLGQGDLGAPGSHTSRGRLNDLRG